MAKRKRSKVTDKSPVKDQSEEGPQDRCKKVRWEGQSRDAGMEDSEVDSEEESAVSQKAYLCINTRFEANVPSATDLPFCLVFPVSSYSYGSDVYV